MYNKKYMYGYSGEKNSFKRNSIEIGVGYTFVLRSIDTRVLRK
jgi:hypothetical protein